MAYNFQIFKEQNLIRDYYTGKFGLEELMQITPLLQQHPDFRWGMDAISDFRSAEIDLNYRDMTILAQHSASKEKWGRLAVVVDSPAHFGLARMYRAMTEEHAGHWIAYEIFTSMEAAE